MKLLLLLLLLAPQLHADDSDTTDQVVGIVSDCLKLGGYSLDALQPLGTIADLGSTVLHMVGVLHHTDDPTMKKLNELSEKLDQLGQQMTQQFKTLTAFMVEEVFYTEMAQTASMLRRFMQDTIETPCNESISHFFFEYTRNPPMEYTYRLLSMLEVPATNPILLAMAADPLRTNATFQKWRAIIDAISSEFLFIETYANGLFFDLAMYEPTKMVTRLTEMQGKIEGWKQGYMKSYWPSIVQEVMNDTQDKYFGGKGGYSNAQRAQAVRDVLSRILTDDAFIIMSYDPCKGPAEHVFSGNNILESWQRSKSNLVVIRSQGWKNATVEEQNAFIQKANEFNDQHYDMPCEKDYSDQSYHVYNSVPNAGMVGIVDSANNMAIAYANNANHGPSMPGVQIRMDNNCKHPTYFDAIVAYK